jgi:diguanylate cyclase (GGDEF)-like protein
VVCRSADLVARYGGEEFVVILPNTDVEGAIAVAERIHGAIKDLAIPHKRLR